MNAPPTRRITPAEVLAAGGRHPEVLLARGEWAKPLTNPERPAGIEFMACPLGLLAIDAGADKWSLYLGGADRTASILGLDLVYAKAFAWAVDGERNAGFDAIQMRRARPIRRWQGIVDGRAVAAAVFGEGATP